MSKKRKDGVFLGQGSGRMRAGSYFFQSFTPNWCLIRVRHIFFMIHLLLIFIIFCLTEPAHAIEFWHSSTIWANEGKCAAIFYFDSGMEEINDLHVSVSIMNKTGKIIGSDFLVIEHFGRSEADRYANAPIVREDICEDNLIILVSKATAIINGKPMDLLKTKNITARNFKPFKIRINR